jgi:signal transduction histidine kinase
MAIGESKDRIYLGGIALSKNYNGDHWILGHVEKLTTAFLNIIVNAIESIRSDKGKIWISVYEANGTTRITFKDNGSGMAPHIAEKMFDPHFSTKDGLGVGLTTVNETMNLHRANIVADSLPDVGTSISILFNSLSHDQLKIRSGNVKDSMSNGH